MGLIIACLWQKNRWYSERKEHKNHYLKQFGCWGNSLNVEAELALDGWTLKNPASMTSPCFTTLCKSGIAIALHFPSSAPAAWMYNKMMTWNTSLCRYLKQTRLPATLHHCLNASTCFTIDVLELNTFPLLQITIIFIFWVCLHKSLWIVSRISQMSIQSN